jgi:hypothetical protein
MVSPTETWRLSTGQPQAFRISVTHWSVRRFVWSGTLMTASLSTISAPSVETWTRRWPQSVVCAIASITCRPSPQLALPSYGSGASYGSGTS